ncbi:MAG: hypothetical protein MJ074_06755 [Oscillospiraceae bacterium]|nr:hypothetical protein [Oscillospiraceae bacterium]
MAGYYDPNKDYSKELQRTDLSAAQRSQLETERANKIESKYGGVEPTMTGSNQTFSSVYNGNGGSVSSGSAGGGVSGGSAAGSSVYGVPNFDTVEKNYVQDGVHYQTGADMSRRPEMAGQVATSNGYTVYYDDRGYVVKAVKGTVDYTPHVDPYVTQGVGGGKLWTDENMLTAADQQRISDIRAQMNAGLITGDQANAQANAIRSGYGYTIDKAGNVTDLGALGKVNARREAQGLPTVSGAAGSNGQDYVTAWQQAIGQQAAGLPDQQAAGVPGQQGGFSVDGYGSFEDFMRGMGYDSYESATQKAIQAAVQQAINGYNDQIAAVNSDTEELARQAYIAKMLGQKNLDQELAANGYAGGMADSQRIATELNYQNQLGALEKQKQDTIKELQTAITNAQLSGDMQTAQELQAYIMQLEGQWNNYLLTQQNMANENYWRQQNMANENYWRQQELDDSNYWNQQSVDSKAADNAYDRAMTLIGAGVMPDATMLTAAGISQGNAQQLVNLAKAAATAGRSSSGGSGTKYTSAQAETALAALMRGDNSAATRQIVESYYKMPADSVLLAYGNGSPAGNPQGGVTLGATASNLLNRYLSSGGGLTTARKQDLNNAYMDGQITEAELNTILDRLGY